jgi:HD-GYP domain-containing protein (c-di-GMP phosphodiesterase class II)/DNA-binding CsgD family transcriptional regulator
VVAVTHKTVRLAEVVTALSLASDVGHDQPLEKSLRNAVLAVRLGDELGLRGEDLSAAYYVSLLRSMGCTSNSHETALLLGGDDRAILGLVQELSGGDFRGWARGLARQVATVAPELAPERTEAWFLTDGLAAGRRARDSACEVSIALARRVGLPDSVQTGLGQVYERWDGFGPAGIAGEDLCPAARISHIVDVAEIALRAGGVGAVRDLVRRRAGSHFDPAIATVFDDCAGDLLDGLEDADMLVAALDAEPAPYSFCSSGALADLARAIADFADLKSPWSLGHSPAVGELAAAAVQPQDAETLLIAGLLHELGRVAVPNGIWDRAASLGPAQWERVRLHAYYTERILARTPAFEHLARLAGSHHERLDGTGYCRGLGGDALSEQMRVLAAADAYVAMRADRPHRRALERDAAAAELQRAARDGLLCQSAVGAVLEAAGHERQPSPPAPCGLSDREVEVLRLLARGLTNKQIAVDLFLSARTVQHHLAHIYDKIDRRTRSGAAMFAMEHRLLA